MAEGLFTPSQCRIPGLSEDRLHTALVRVRPRTVLCLDWAQNADEVRTRARNESLPDGSERWYRYFLREDAGRVDDPRFFMGMVSFEFSRHLRGGGSLPAEVLLDGGGTGFAISTEGHVLTNYHLVTSEISNYARLDGRIGAEDPCRTLRVQIARQHQGRQWQWSDADEVYLVSNPPEHRAILDRGDNTGELREDTALLRVVPAPAQHLKLARRVAALGEPAWMAGFPLRSARSDAAKAKHRYGDADGTLRVSVGTVTRLDATEYFETDCDGSMGNSGSPVIAAGGEVLGMFSRGVGDGPRNAFEYGHVSRVQVSSIFADRGLELRGGESA